MTPAQLQFITNTLRTNANLMEQGIDGLMSIEKLIGEGTDEADWIKVNIENLRLLWTTFSVAADSVEHEGHNHG